MSDDDFSAAYLMNIVTETPILRLFAAARAVIKADMGADAYAAVDELEAAYRALNLEDEGDV